MESIVVDMIRNFTKNFNMATRNHILQKLTLIKKVVIRVKTEVDAILKRRRNDVKREFLLYILLKG